jgi:L-seryl-tRNA(Ser) seleniumtransferase
MSADRTAALRRLPSVDEMVRRLASHAGLSAISKARVTAAVRDLLDAERRRLLSKDGEAVDVESLTARVADALTSQGPVSLRTVINATGVVLHTNLGRALLSERARQRLADVATAYSNLELDLASKERGSRYSHVEGLLTRLTGGEDALVVNNNAAAVLLALETLARGREVIVSRGELIEIGGEFRIPDIMRRSGATLREVGTTNRTHPGDYTEAIGPDTALILKVHTSNYRVVGFTAEVPARELVELARARAIPVMEDLGSGCLVDLRPCGFPPEPTVPEAVAAGVDLVCFSGDKLLGGPQAGIIIGKAALVSRLERNPLNRALRVDKLTLAALEATLQAYEDGDALHTVPTLRLLTEPLAAVRARANRVLRALPAAVRERLDARVETTEAEVGGGALPTLKLPSAALTLGADAETARRLDAALRATHPAVLGRMLENRLYLDCRTVLPEQVPALAGVLVAVAP